MYFFSFNLTFDARYRTIIFLRIYQISNEIFDKFRNNDI